MLEFLALSRLNGLSIPEIPVDPNLKLRVPKLEAFIVTFDL